MQIREIPYRLTRNIGTKKDFSQKTTCIITATLQLLALPQSPFGHYRKGANRKDAIVACEVFKDCLFVGSKKDYGSNRITSKLKDTGIPETYDNYIKQKKTGISYH